MDIKSGSGYPASKLSNFSAAPFTFDGVECNSMEGLLQSFKFDKEHIQQEVCKLVGLGAKRRGSKRNKAWKSKQTLWWRGIAYDRKSDDYQRLLDLAFDALAQNESFRKALIATNDAVLRHSIGRSKKSETALTEQEFVSRLTKMRDRINKGEL